jgi:hypothetical protein
VCQVGDSRTLLIIEQKAMAPSTVGGLAGGMAHSGHILHENYEVTGVRGPAPASAYIRGPNLRHGDLGPVACGGHTLRTVPDGSIPKFTYIGG